MNFLSTQQVVMTFLLVFSVLPYKYDPKLKVVKSNKLYVAYSVLVSTVLQFVYLVVALLAVSDFSTVVNGGSLVTDMVVIVEVWSFEIGLFITFCNGVLKGPKQIEFLNNLTQIENAVNNLRYNISKRKSYKNFKWNSIWSLVAVIAFFATFSNVLCLLKIKTLIKICFRFNICGNRSQQERPSSSNVGLHNSSDSPQHNCGFLSKARRHVKLYFKEHKLQY